MKHHLLAGAAAVALLAAGSVAANAADLPAPAVPMIAAAPPAYFDWSGFYAGLHIGYGFKGRVDFQGGGGADHDVDGVLGGGQIGFNWQWNSFVAGLEADISGTGIDGQRNLGGGIARISTDVNFIGTARGRVGFAWDRVLIYGTGGFAYADIDESLRILGVSRNDSQMHIGWTAGGGVEGALTDNITLRAEYLYVDLGRERYRWGFPAPVGAISARADYTQHIVRVGVNYKF